MTINPAIKNYYKEWALLKQQINKKKNISKINEREICFVSIGQNIGYEQNGKNEEFERPVLVLKKFGIYTFIRIPLTRQGKLNKFYFNFLLNEKQSFAILSQIRLFDTKRIKRKMGYMTKDDFIKLKQKCKYLIKTGHLSIYKGQMQIIIHKKNDIKQLCP